MLACLVIGGNAALCIAGPFEPTVAKISPPGGQRGAELELVLEGARLENPAELMWYEPGISVKKLEFRDGKAFATLEVAADCRLGEHAVRLRTPGGLSELRTFYVGMLPSVDEKEPNNNFEQAQQIDLNVTVHGVIENEDVDCFAVELKKDQRLSVAVEGLRLGRTMFDPHIAIFDSKEKELAACDDHPLVRQDCLASIVAPDDGTYYVRLRESTFAGNGNCNYRLHIGTFPMPTTALPLGGKPGEEISLRLLGDIRGDIQQKATLPDADNQLHPLFVEVDGEVSPVAIPLRVVDLPNVQQSEDNSYYEVAQAIDLPAAVNGVIKSGQHNFYRFAAKQGQVYDIRCYARKLGSPLDTVIDIYNHERKHLVANDDSNGPDSYLRFTAPGDGDHYLVIRDQLLRGGPTYNYRIEVAPVRPNLTVTIPKVQQFSQDRQTIVIARGNRYASRVGVDRQDVGGDVTISAEDLPPGVTASQAAIIGSQSAAPMLFEAAADAPLTGAFSALSGKFTDPNQSLVGQYRQRFELVIAENQNVFWDLISPKMAVVVTDELPYKLTIVEPKAPLVGKGSMQLKVLAERKEGFTAPINVELIHNAPNVTNASTVTIPEGQNEVLIPLNANNVGPNDHGKWPIVAMGQATVEGGRAWAASQMATLEVAGPFVEFTLKRAAGEQGKQADIVCEVKQNTAFDGAAKVSLLGLPNKVTTDELEITKDTKELIFPVKIDAESPVGKHQGVVCQVVITLHDEPIVHSVGTTELRIDPPTAPKVATEAKPEPEPQPAEAPAKQLTRLEKLRLEAQESGTN